MRFMKLLDQNVIWNTIKLQVVRDPAPRLPPNQFSKEFEDFICRCLVKDVTERATYSDMMEPELAFLQKRADKDQMSNFVTEILELANATNPPEEDGNV